MIKLKTILTSTIMSFVASTAYASGLSFYSADTICDNDYIFNEIYVSKSNYNKYYVDIYKGKRIDAKYMKYQLSGFAQDGFLILKDNKGLPVMKLDIPDNKDIITGQWLTRSGMPIRKCSDVLLGKVSSPKERWDNLFAVLEQPFITPKIALEAIYLKGTLPPSLMLPELDIILYEEKLDKTWIEFWPKYYSIEKNKLEKMPIQTDEEQKALISEMRLATQFSISPSGSIFTNEQALDTAYDYLYITTHRLEDKKNKVTMYDLKTQDQCKNFAATVKPSLKAIELMVGLPAENWSRSMTETILQSAKECHGAKGVVDQIIQSYPEIERRHQAYEWKKTALKPFADLPKTLAAFKSSNWMILNDANSAMANMTEEEKSKYLNVLDEERKERSELAIYEMGLLFNSYDLTTLPFGKVPSMCEEILGKIIDDTLVKNMFDACKKFSFEYYQKQEIKIVDDQVNKILLAPKNLDGLRNNNWFSLSTDGYEDWKPTQKALDSFQKRTETAFGEAVAASVMEPDNYLPEKNMSLNKISDNFEGTYCDTVINIYDDEINHLTEDRLLLVTQMIEYCNMKRKSDFSNAKNHFCGEIIQTHNFNQFDFIEYSVVKDPNNYSLKDYLCAWNINRVDIDINKSGWWNTKYSLTLEDKKNNLSYNIPLDIKDNKVSLLIEEKSTLDVLQCMTIRPSKDCGVKKNRSI